MSRNSRLILILACFLLIPTVSADYPELMKAVQLNTGQPNWQHVIRGANPNSGEQATMDFYVDTNSIQNIATPWISFHSLEIYTPYTETVVTIGTKVSAISSITLMNCQTNTETPIAFKIFAPDKTLISERHFSQPRLKTSAPNSPSSHIAQLVCNMAYQLQPTPKFDSAIVPNIKPTNTSEWVAYAESKQPHKTATIYYDKKSLTRKNNDMLSYTMRETFSPFSLGIYGNNKITSRVTNKITNCTTKQETTSSISYYGLNNKLLHTYKNPNTSLKADNPRSIEEAVRHDVCMYIDSLPMINNDLKEDK